MSLLQAKYRGHFIVNKRTIMIYSLKRSSLILPGTEVYTGSIQVEINCGVFFVCDAYNFYATFFMFDMCIKTFVVLCMQLTASCLIILYFGTAVVQPTVRAKKNPFFMAGLFCCFFVFSCPQSFHLGLCKVEQLLDIFTYSCQNFFYMNWPTCAPPYAP